MTPNPNRKAFELDALTNTVASMLHCPRGEHKCSECRKLAGKIVVIVLREQAALEYARGDFKGDASARKDEEQKEVAIPSPTKPQDAVSLELDELHSQVFFLRKAILADDPKKQLIVRCKDIEKNICRIGVKAKSPSDDKSASLCAPPQGDKAVSVQKDFITLRDLAALYGISEGARIAEKIIAEQTSVDDKAVYKGRDYSLSLTQKAKEHLAGKKQSDVEIVAKAIYLHMFPEYEDADWEKEKSFDNGRLYQAYTSCAKAAITALNTNLPEGETNYPEKPVSWDYCPECGEQKYQRAYGGSPGERVCLGCGQSWFPDVNYTNAVRGNLAERHKPSPPLSQEGGE